MNDGYISTEDLRKQKKRYEHLKKVLWPLIFALFIAGFIGLFLGAKVNNSIIQFFSFILMSIGIMFLLYENSLNEKIETINNSLLLRAIPINYIDVRLKNLPDKVNLALIRRTPDDKVQIQFFANLSLSEEERTATFTFDEAKKIVDLSLFKDR